MPTVVASATTNISNGVFIWSTGATTSQITVTAPGVYTATVTNPITGCSASATASIVSNTGVPNLTFTQPLIGCGSVMLPIINSPLSLVSWQDLMDLVH